MVFPPRVPKISELNGGECPALGFRIEQRREWPALGLQIEQRRECPALGLRIEQRGECPALGLRIEKRWMPRYRSPASALEPVQRPLLRYIGQRILQTKGVERTSPSSTVRRPHKVPTKKQLRFDLLPMMHLEGKWMLVVGSCGQQPDKS
ncbi:hypothetical protein AVEN_21952-1 [Araneus ventricosus]|uniref:Uncharacterized protein n=1 Tax=Araneus ventricosus TaxID=182803 RepID=A0A4Y2P182_ARAVE|nr:hypothetical protein AVEN_21952-1 [Araneus ventricosus]